VRLAVLLVCLVVLQLRRPSGTKFVKCQLIVDCLGLIVLNGNVEGILNKIKNCDIHAVRIHSLERLDCHRIDIPHDAIQD